MRDNSRMKAGERRAQLLDVARRCFAEKGFDRTTTARIAAEARVSEPILYKHFKSKMALYQATIDDVLRRSREHLDRVVEGQPDGASRLLAIVGGHRDFTRDHRASLQMLDRALAGTADEATRASLKNYYEGLIGRLSRHIREGQLDGSIDPSIDPEAMAGLLVMAGVGYRLVAGMGGAAVSSDGHSRRLRSLVAALIAPCDDRNPDQRTS